MGKKGSWFSAVKKAWNSDNKKKDKEAQSRGAETEKKESFDNGPQNGETALLNPLPEMETTARADGDEQSRHAYSVAFASAIAAEAAVAAAKAAAEVIRLTSVARSSRKSMEEMAAIRIQSAFRGYLARRAHQGLRKLVRLKSMISERSVKQQAMTTLKCMQTIAKLQAEVRARRNRLSEENRTLQRQLQQKPEKDLEKSKTSSPGGKFDVSTHTKEQIKAKIETRQEAAKRRERALSYANTHQMTRRSSLKSTNQTMDPNDPQWGWSWLERWMAARPWENRIAVMKELSSNDTAPVKTTTPKVNARSSNKDLRNDLFPVKTTPKVNDSKSSATPTKQRCPPATRQLPVEVTPKGSHGNDDPRSKSSVNLSSKGSHENDYPRSKSSVNLSSKGSHENDDPRSKISVNPSSMGSLENHDPRNKTIVNLSSKEIHENDDPRSKTSANLSSKGIQVNDDPRSNPSENSEHSRRHSSAEAMERECDHISRPQVNPNPTFMAPMEIRKARSRKGAPLLVLEKRYGTMEKGGPGKKKLSSHGATRRHSAPPALI
ncbi:protein IQ-DOMAIN 1-like [Ipomoea triloba]|uniref:protein IQ-DOMAIN 1-like n=1 Tax=Ipomoea triloba TaxID=35885 RepID=UPI00125D905B|nr:protein IQ-DOMAIN 1-like [Ipomoea triloba]XP_031104853.1 protein IQ-DOMAIN 1-like [Ipomoea triloba]